MPTTPRESYYIPPEHYPPLTGRQRDAIIVAFAEFVPAVAPLADRRDHAATKTTRRPRSASQARSAENRIDLR